MKKQGYDVVWGNFDNSFKKKAAITYNGEFLRNEHGYSSNKEGAIKTFKTKKNAWLWLAKK
jgi:hypothetical protein